MEKYPILIIGNYILPLKCGFGIGYGISRKYQPICVSVSVLDLNQNSGFGHHQKGNFLGNSPRV
jgi:hypothetical protein